MRMNEGFRVDPSLVSIMLIVLISSALVVFSLASEKIESPVVILKNIFPPVLFSQASVSTRERMDFSLSLAARQNIATLEIQYSILVQVEPRFAAENASSPDPQTMAADISPISALIEATENEDVPYEALEVEGSVRNLSYSGIFYDFPIVRLYSDPSVSPEVYTSFLVFQNETGTLYFEGISDFFLNRLGGYADIQLPEEDMAKSAITSLRIRRNENVTSYSSAPDAPTGWGNMEEAPEFGRVIFGDVKKHDTFSVDFTVDTPRRPQKWSAQVIRIYADGELVDMVVNIIE